MRFQGKAVIVTGAGSGMGRAMALGFAVEGASVVGADVNMARLDAVREEATAAGGTMRAERCDVSSPGDVDALVRTAIEAFGRLDVLVNNAGIMDAFEGVANVQDDKWERVMAVNLTGPMRLSRAAVRIMKEAGGGAIVNVASVAGVGGAAAGAAYTASKHGLIGLTRNTAYTYGPANVRCNAIVVGGVETNISESIDMPNADQEALAQYGRWHAAAPRQLQPEDVARVALFLASDDASGVNGALLSADAGWTAA